MQFAVSEPTSPAAASDTPIPSCLSAIFAELSQQGISYCYWKSSLRIERALSGEGDVDLLVALSDLHRFELILNQEGFKRFPSTANCDHPSISSYLGFDERTGRLFHLHVHFKLILGEPLFKNYHIPWEQALLARTITHPLFRVRTLDPAAEALLLAVRKSIELSPVDPVNLRNMQSIKQKFALDQEALRQRVDLAQLRGLAGGLLSQDMADLPAQILFDTGVPGQSATAARRMRSHLALFRSYNGLEARLRGFWAAIQWAAGGLNKTYLHIPRPWSRRAPGGGRVVAMIGVDGSGKSTAVSTIKSWLKDEVDVMPIYFGTGDGRPSLLLLPLKLLVPLATSVIGVKPKGSSHGKVSDKKPGALYSVLLTIWSTVLAFEKRGKLISAHRGADRGMFVLTDRYPQDEIAEFNDSPLLVRLSNVPDWLRRFEARAYALSRRLPPDLVVKLIVRRETAARREPDMSPALIDKRLNWVTQLKFSGARIASIDAEQPLEKVILAIKREVWRTL